MTLLLRNIRAGYGGDDVLRGVDLTVEAGSITCIVGPNGAGKSTVLRVISGLLRPRQGELSFEGRSLVGLSPRQVLARGIVQVPQNHSLFPRMSVAENVRLGGYTVADTALVERRLREVQDLFPIVRERARERAGSLSGGQQRLVEFARCLMLDPKVVLLDEPSMGLDPRTLKQVFEMITVMRDTGRAILLVEQNARSGLRISTHGVVMESGRIRLEGSHTEILENPEIGALYLGGTLFEGADILTAMSLFHLRICTFKGSQNLPLFVAAQRGFFAARGLEVEILYTGGSASQIAGLAGGEYHLIQTAHDNVINANCHPAAFGLDPATTPRITMLMGGSVGPLSLSARPAVAAFPDLRGAVLGVDNPTSGFALVLRDMLARAGLADGIDYGLAVAGGTSSRLDALRSGVVAATILYPPHTALAEEAGCRTLATSTTLYPAYASLALAGLAAWVETHGDRVTGAIAAMLEALRRIHDPAHAAEAQQILRHELALTAPVATQAYAAFVDPLTGFGREATLSDAGLQQVIALRATAGAPLGRLGLPAEHLDLRWYRRAWTA